MTSTPKPSESTTGSADDRLKLLEQFIAALTHDFRTPLTVIRNASYILRRTRSDMPEITEYVDLIDTEVSEINVLLTRLVEVCHENELNITDAPLIDMLDGAARKADSEKRMTWRFVVEFEPSTLQCDPTRLQHVFHQIFKNAVTATKGIGTITVRAVRGGNGVTIDVDDDGPGVAADIRDRIFDPFFTTKKTGMGLGLTYCRQIVQRHGGELRLQETQPGASFRMTFPAG